MDVVRDQSSTVKQTFNKRGVGVRGGRAGTCWLLEASPEWGDLGVPPPGSGGVPGCNGSPCPCSPPPYTLCARTTAPEKRQENNMSRQQLHKEAETWPSRSTARPTAR